MKNRRIGLFGLIGIVTVMFWGPVCFVMVLLKHHNTRVPAAPPVVSEGKLLNDHAYLKPVATTAVRDTQIIDGVTYPVAKLSVVCLVGAVGRPIRFPGGVTVDGSDRSGFVVKLHRGPNGSSTYDGVGYSVGCESVGTRIVYGSAAYDSSYVLDPGKTAVFTITMKALIKHPEETHIHRKMQLLAVELGFADTDPPYLYQMVPLDELADQLTTPMLSITPRTQSLKMSRAMERYSGLELMYPRPRKVPLPDPSRFPEPLQHPAVREH